MKKIVMKENVRFVDIILFLKREIESKDANRRKFAYEVIKVFSLFFILLLSIILITIYLGKSIEW